MRIRPYGRTGWHCCSILPTWRTVLPIYRSWKDSKTGSLAMKLKPLRFIGHKIGPFDHIELNWDKNSHYTLIVAENGMGKTTLVATIAACLSLGNESLISPEQ